MKEKKALLRIVRNAQGEISFDRIGKAPGRGSIYLQIEGMPDESGSPEAAWTGALETKIDEAVLSQLMEEVDET